MAYQLGHIPAHKGQQVAEEPIRTIESIGQIKSQLSARSTRDFALFVLGINAAFRCGDLVKIKLGQVRGKKAGDDIVIREDKTGKLRRVTLNEQSASALARILFVRRHADNDELLFVGQRGPLTVSYVNRMVKSWCSDVGLDGQYGSHTLRKTWAYHQRVTFKTDIEQIMDALNHSSPRQTLTYICIQPEELREVYANAL